MHFQQPNMLWGLLLLAIPLLIHLFQFHRTKTLYFPGVFRLTQRLQQARQRKKLEHWLVLASRLLGILCLVLAFAMPSCENQQASNKGYSHVLLLVDNGFSLSIETQEGQLIEQVKSQARAILNDLPAEAQVKLVSQTTQTDLWMSPSQIASLLDTLGVGPQRYSLKDWIEKAELASQESGVQSIATIVFTDAQSTFLSGLQAHSQPTNIDWRFVSFNSNPDDVKGGNLSLDTAWYVSQFSSDSKATGLLMKARVSHRGGQAKEARLSLLANGKTLFAQTKEIAPGQTVEFEGLISPENASESLLLQLGKDGYVYDDQLYLHPVKTWQTRVGVIGGDRSLDALFAAQPLLQKQLIRTSDIEVNPAVLVGLDAMVVVGVSALKDKTREAIRAQVEAGTTLLQFPTSATSQPQDILGGISSRGTWRKVSQRLALPGLNHPVFQGAFAESLSDKVQLPLIRNVFQSDAFSDWETVIQLEDGQPLLVLKRMEIGTQWLWLSDLNEGSKEFLNSGWYLPLVTQILASNALQEKPLYGVLFSKQLLSLPAPISTDERAAQLVGERGTSVVELQVNSERHTSMYVGVEPSYSGLFELKSPLEKSAVLVAFNWPRVESNLQTDPNLNDKLGLTKLTWKQSLADGRTSILQNEPLKVLWRLFMWGAAIFFAVEVLLLLWQSRNKRLENQ
ncbi:MAG: hypothetical protein FJX91_05145 [Bacteroidetes bacterium]|nr:hypothetical protein [Bacteroidota bacterium]